MVNKLETLLIDDARVVIYDCRMFITQATGGFVKDSVLVTDNLRDYLTIKVVHLSYITNQ